MVSVRGLDAPVPVRSFFFPVSVFSYCFRNVNMPAFACHSYLWIHLSTATEMGIVISNIGK